jgi:hypothetical protein
VNRRNVADALVSFVAVERAKQSPTALLPDGSLTPQGAARSRRRRDRFRACSLSRSS